MPPYCRAEIFVEQVRENSRWLSKPRFERKKTFWGEDFVKTIGIDEHASLLHCNISKYAVSNFHRFFSTCACSDRWTWTLALIMMRQVFYHRATVTGQIFIQRLKLIILSFFLWIEGGRGALPSSGLVCYEHPNRELIRHHLWLNGPIMLVRWMLN